MYTSIHSHVRVHTNLGDALSSSHLQKQSAVHSLKRAIGAITSTRAQDCRYVVVVFACHVYNGWKKRV